MMSIRLGTAKKGSAYYLNDKVKETKPEAYSGCQKVVMCILQGSMLT